MYKIADTCVSCHNCAMECPMQAISYNGLKHEIDEDKCIECGLCEKLCHTASISDVDAEVNIPKHSPIYKECDLVVCGTGTGLIAAIRAAQAGKKVIILEKSKKTGGNTDYAHGFFPVYTKWHERDNLADVREEAIDVFWERSNKGIEKELIRAAVYGSGEFFDWLLQFPETERAFDFMPLGEKRMVGPMYSTAMVHFPRRMYDNLLCRDMAIGPGWSGTFIKYRMFDAIREQKLDVEIFTEHAARHLQLDEKGQVSGIIAETPGGEMHIKTKAVVLATGGMGQSDEKLQKYFNFFDRETVPHRFSVKGDTGDAIDMLQELGVEPDPKRMFVSLFGQAHHPFSYAIYRILEQPSCVHVNLNGERWLNEEGGLFMGRFTIDNQPKEISYGIFTQKNIDRIRQEFLDDQSLSEEHWVYERVQEDFEEEINYPKPPVFRADTIEGLAEKMGVDPSKLHSTINEYNEFCEKGKDEKFGKAAENLRAIEAEGPYYAIYGQRFSEGAFGGLRVNAGCEVLRKDGTAIPGLYGVGDATSAMHQKDELAPISELTWGVASSFISGGNAIDYINKKVQA